jgi:hypothetical protein
MKIDTAGKKIRSRVYLSKGKGRFPLMLYFHVGGFVIAGLTITTTPRLVLSACTRVPSLCPSMIAKARKTSFPPPTMTPSPPVAGAWRT